MGFGPASENLFLELNRSVSFLNDETINAFLGDDVVGVWL